MEMRKRESVMKDAEAAELRLEDVAKIYELTSELIKKFGTFIKAVAVFGSFARREKHNDIDIMVIVDDSFAPLDQTLYAAFKLELQKIGRKYPSFHMNPVTISQFWDATRRGDPLAIQVLRDGIALVDAGFFSPLKRLLIQGKIRPTDEAVSAALSRAFYNLNGYTRALLSAASTLYWAAVEAAHAGIMAFGHVPGSPREVTSLLRRTLLKEGVITARDVRAYEEAFKLEKGIAEGKITYVDSATLEKLHEGVARLVTKIDRWVNEESIKKAMGGVTDDGKEGRAGKE